MNRTIVTIAIAALVTLALAWAGLGRALGAHPIWAFKTGWIGVLVALGLALALPFLRRARTAALGVCALGLVMALAAAHLGKGQFAASYAEDRIAGLFWFGGWIAAWAAFCLGLATAIRIGLARFGR